MTKQHITLLMLVSLAACSRPEEVEFSNGAVTLVGDFRVPEGPGPFPAIVMIHGSGQEDRSALRHYARLFVDLGVATVSYDKRGVGESGGDPDAWRYFDFDDLAGDAAAGVEYLAVRGDIDTDRIGLFATSQGGWIAPLAAAKSDIVSFMVVVSASVSTVSEDRLFERAARLRSEGFTEAEIVEVTAMQRIDQEVTRSGGPFDELTRLWNKHVEKRWFRRVYLGDQPLAPDHDYRRWYRTVLDFGPAPILEDLTAPVLWLFGDPSLDRFGPVAQSVNTLGALAGAGKDYTVHVLEGADHSLVIDDESRRATFDWLAAVIGPWLEARVTDQ